MKKIIVSILLIALFSGCGSKKKISNMSKGYEVTYDNIKNDTNTQEVKVTNEVTKDKEVVKEVYDEETIENYIFDSDGRVVSATKTTKKKGQKDMNKESEKNKSDSAYSSASSSSETSKATETKTEAESEFVEPLKQRNPIWNWIGGALFICILFFFAWKVIFKR